MSPARKLAVWIAASAGAWLVVIGVLTAVLLFISWLT
jgi:hypothetical protein